MTARLDVDTDYIVREYHAGKSGTKIALDLGVSEIVVYGRLKEAGVEMRPSGATSAAFNKDEAVAAYVGGESENSVAKRCGVSRAVIRRLLVSREIHVRSQSEAESLKWSGMSGDQRARQVAAAHVAARGRTATDEERIKGAQTREVRPSNIGPDEVRLAAMLAERGIETIPQKAIGKYNVDLSAAPVAIEIWGGNWHWSGRHVARVDTRFRFILDQGWHLLVLPITKYDHLTDALADYVASYVLSARDDHAAEREYRVAWSNGRISTSGYATDDEINITLPADRRVLLSA